MSPRAIARAGSADRSVAVGVLGLRTARYLGEGRRAFEGIEGLRIRSARAPEVPIYHAATGIYGFLALPPGPNRLQIEDPRGRWLPRVLLLDVADRAAAATAPHAGTLIEPLALRASIGAPPRGAETAVYGVVIDAAGRPVPFARLRIETRFDGSAGAVVAFTDFGGTYLALLPGERSVFQIEPDGEEDPLAPEPPTAAAEPLTVRHERELSSVHVLAPDVRAALERHAQRGEDPLQALPPGFDVLPPGDPDSPYEAWPDFELRPAEPGPTDPGHLRIHVGRRVRCDVHLSPPA